MNRIAFFSFILLLITPQLWAQEKTLTGGKLESGGFGAPVVKFTDIDGEFAVFAGARGGWIINHTFVIGAGGYGLASDLDGEFPFTRALEFGYGGLELEYIYRSDELVHISIYTLVGGGGVVEVFNNDLTDTVFVLEPAANVVFNVARFFRFGVGAGYRFVAGADLSFDNDDLSAFVGTVTLKFGSF